MTRTIPSPDTVARDPVLFAHHLIKIQTKLDAVVPLDYNAIQLDYLSHRTPLDIILKPRQIGFSTAIQTEFRRYEWTRRCRTLVLDKDDVNTRKNRRRADFAYEHLPEGFRPERDTNNDVITTYPGIGSEAIIMTAGNKTSGRGDTYSYIHGSEVAFWNDAASIIAGAGQAGAPRWIVLESTPNGARGWFYEECMKAARGDSAYRLHFYPWFRFAEYQLPLADGEVLTYTDEEKAAIQSYGLTPAQVKWRRVKQKELPDTFIQEYPEDPYTCFLASGDSYFGDLSKVFTAPPDAAPETGVTYAAGLDFGQSNDYTVLIILHPQTLRMVDMLRINRLSWADMRAEIVSRVTRWNNARVLAEWNSIGSVNIEELRKAGLDVVPFMTTPQSKPPLIQSLKYGLTEAGLTLQNDAALKSELQTFVSRQTPNGVWTYEAQQGAHDDTVVSLALAYYLARTMQGMSGNWSM